MTLVKFFEYIDRKAAHLERMATKLPPRELRHIAYEVIDFAQTCVDTCSDYKFLHMKMASRRDRKKFSYVVEGEYTDFEAAMNNTVYGMNVKEGEHYSITVKPDWTLKLGKKKYPVFFDDPGQCYFIRISDSKTIATQSFSFCPEMEFLYAVIEDIIMTRVEAAIAKIENA